jgi:hypothetical protein
MKLNEFKVGTVFYTATSRWICTDVGTRFVIATQFYPSDTDLDLEMSVHHAFDAFELEGCCASEEEAVRHYGEDLRTFLRLGRRRLEVSEFDPKRTRTFSWRRLARWGVRPYRSLQVNSGSMKGPGWLVFNFHVCRSGDHPGWELIFMLFKRGIAIEYGDSRHLDRKTGRMY